MCASPFNLLHTKLSFQLYVKCSYCPMRSISVNTATVLSRNILILLHSLLWLTNDSIVDSLTPRVRMKCYVHRGDPIALYSLSETELKTGKLEKACFWLGWSVNACDGYKTSCKLEKHFVSCSTSLAAWMYACMHVQYYAWFMTTHCCLFYSWGVFIEPNDEQISSVAIIASVKIFTLILLPPKSLF